MLTSNYDPKDDTSGTGGNFEGPIQCSSVIAWGSKALRCGKEEGHDRGHRPKSGGITWSDPECPICESRTRRACSKCDWKEGL